MIDSTLNPLLIIDCNIVYYNLIWYKKKWKGGARELSAYIRACTSLMV